MSTHTYNPCLTWETQLTTKPQLGLSPIQWSPPINDNWLLLPQGTEAGCPVDDLWNGLCDLSPTSFCSNWSQTILTMNDIVQLIGLKTKKGNWAARATDPHKGSLIDKPQDEPQRTMWCTTDIMGGMEQRLCHRPLRDWSGPLTVNKDGRHEMRAPQKWG